MRLPVWYALLALPGLLSAQEAAKDDEKRCVMYDECGRKGSFGGMLPCPDSSPPRPADALLQATLAQVCGPSFLDSLDGAVCCSSAQVLTLSVSLAQAEPLIASCPACRSNFRHWYCSFTCSPDQSDFVELRETQKVAKDGQEVDAVKRVDVTLSEKYAEGFFGSCKDVKFGATNGYAMDLLGGGASDPLDFLRYMGTERALGSPFTIAYPEYANSTRPGFLEEPKKCDGTATDERCACLDCPAVCAALPPLESREEHAARACKVGKLPCGQFAVIILYAVVLLAAAAWAGVLQVDPRSRESFAKAATGAWMSARASFGKLAERAGGGRGPDPSESGYDRLPLSDPRASIDELSDTEEDGAVPALAAGAEGPDEAPTPTRKGRRDTSRTSTADSTTPSGATSASAAENGSSLSRSRLRASGISNLTTDGDPFAQPRVSALNDLVSRSFYSLGLRCARSPYLTLAVALAVCALVNLGWAAFEVERDPVRLWVPRGSEAAKAKEAFEDAFGPFFRTEQVLLDRPPVDGSWGKGQPVGDWETVKWWAGVEERVRQLKSKGGIKLEDVCLAPAATGKPAAEECVTQSWLSYFPAGLEELSEDGWTESLEACVESPGACLPLSGAPISPALVLGGREGGAAAESKAWIITWVLENSLDTAKVARAEGWEAELESLLRTVQVEGRERGLRVSWSTGGSLEEELNRSGNTDVAVVVGSYLLMFAYIATNLGSSGSALVRVCLSLLALVGRFFFGLLPAKLRPERRPRSDSLDSFHSYTQQSWQRQILVEGKVVLGLWGIGIVLLSVSTSVALFSALGVKVTLIIAEVIPFLVLAIGVDNVFLLVHELDRQTARSVASAARRGDLDLPPAEERVAKALARMGPSILLSASCEATAFALGAIVGMPAVRNFAIYAAGAVVLNTALQCTVFVAALALDLKRVEDGRVDCLPCLRLPGAGTTGGEALPQMQEGALTGWIKRRYAPLLLKKPVKAAVLVAFSALFVGSWLGAQHIQLGLDQRLALPQDSYLVSYFNAVDAYLDVGPPVYFVVKGMDETVRSEQQKTCGRFTTCDPFSIANVLEAERKRPKVSFLAEPPAVWMDDFFQWLNPLLEDCCRVKKADPKVFCTPRDSEFSCKPCFEDREPEWSITMDGLPTGEEFMSFLTHWLQAPADESCPLGGKAAYSNALKLDASNKTVDLAHFRTYHSPLKTQADFIDALAAAQRISADLSKRTGAEVFPYSLFYVFFEQYAHIVATAREVLTLALLAVFLVTSLFLGSFQTGAVVTITVFLTLMTVMGTMGVWGISLNALSLVNLVICVGIAVEFCAHIARAFMGSARGMVMDKVGRQKERDDRAWSALADVGSSVLSGITFTKLIGISVLALTKSKLLEIYYFRTWLALIVSGALHGLVLLPVLLSLFGGQGYALDRDDEDAILEQLQSRYEDGGRLFRGDNQESDSDDY